MSDQLLKLGCVQNKTKYLEYPNYISRELERHFVRGYFDGDGSISGYEPQVQLRWSVAGTESMCEGIAAVCRRELSVGGGVGPRKGKKSIIYVYQICGRQAPMKVMDWLYEGATIYLERKHAKYKELINNFFGIN